MDAMLNKLGDYLDRKTGTNWIERSSFLTTLGFVMWFALLLGMAHG